MNRPTDAKQAPDVVRQMPYSYAVDWWALGCIVFEGLVGRVPFKLYEENDPVRYLVPPNISIALMPVDGSLE